MKAIIVGASKIEDTSFLKEEGYLKVACDKGYEYFLKERIEPDLLVGDFDTLNEEKIQSPKQIEHLNPIKDDTDTLHAINMLLKQGVNEFHLHGCCGGKTDHFIANIKLLGYLLNHQAKSYLYSEDEKSITMMIQDSITFKKEAKGMLSVFAFGDVAYGVCETNLMYEIQDYTMMGDDTIGISNQFLSNGRPATVSVRKGTLILTTSKENLF